MTLPPNVGARDGCGAAQPSESSSSGAGPAGQNSTVELSPRRMATPTVSAGPSHTGERQ